MSYVNLSFGSWVRVARTLAASASLSIKYVEEDEIKRVGAQAWTDSRYLYLRAPVHTWTDEQFKLWLYYLLHEIGHNRVGRRECFDILQRERPTGLLAYTFNLLEDHVQEFAFSEAEPVVRGKLSEGRSMFYETLVNDPDQPTDPDTLADMAPSVTLFSWDATLRQAFQPHTQGWAYQLASPVLNDARVAEWHEALRDGDYADVLKDVPSCEETFELSKRIVEEVFGYDAQQMCSTGQASGGGTPEDNGAGQASGGAEAGAEAGSEEGESSEAGSEEGAESNGSGTGGTVDYSDMFGHNHAKDVRSGKQEGKSGGLIINYDEYFKNGLRYDEFVPRPATDYQIVDTTKGQRCPHDYLRENGPAPPSSLSKRIARYLQANTRNRKLHGKKSGKLSSKNLYRLKVKGAGEARTRVFHKRVLNKSRDVAITLGLDMSGSMAFSGKTPAAIAAITHMHEVISTQLRIPCEIIGYSEDVVAMKSDGHHTCTPWHVIFQSFAKAERTEDIERRVRRSMHFQGCNRDGEFMLWARDRLLKKKAARHIMIMISDGQPRSSTKTDVAAFTKDVIKRIEDDGQVELYAIGVMTQSVHHFYKHCASINHASELEEKLLTVLRDKILGE